MGDALATSPLLLLPLQPPQPPRIRTLFLLNSLCMGGAEKQVVSLFNRLGNDHAINPHSDTETDTDTVAAWLVCLKADYALLPQVDALRRPQVLPWLGVQRGFAWSAVRRLAAQIDALDINVLVCTNLYALLYGWLARRMSRRGRALRLVEVFHTTDIGSRKERFEMALYRRLLPSTDLLVYVCHGQAEQWRAQGLHARQDMVVYNGIDTRHFENHWTAPERAELRRAQGLGAADYVVGLCAVMRPEKAHGDLLQALARLQRDGLRIQALLIGDGPERARIEQQIAALGLGGTVHLTGLVQDVRAAVAACDVMVLSSHAVETFSISALEAMALGKPMVMTRIGGATEQVQPPVNGLLYPPGDVAALADCLRELADVKLRERMGRCAGRDVRRRFGVDRMVSSYRTALQAVVAGQPVRSDPRHASECPGDAADEGSVALSRRSAGWSAG